MFSYNFANLWEKPVLKRIHLEIILLKARKGKGRPCPAISSGDGQNLEFGFFLDFLAKYFGFLGVRSFGILLPWTSWDFSISTLHRLIYYPIIALLSESHGLRSPKGAKDESKNVRRANRLPVTNRPPWS